MADYEHLLIQPSSGAAFEAAHPSFEEDFSDLETSMRSEFSSTDFVTTSRSTMRGESFESGLTDDTDDLASPKKEKKKKSKKDKTKKKKKKKSKEKEKDSSKKSSQAEEHVPDSKTSSTEPTDASTFDSFPVSFDAPGATQPDFTLSLKDDSDSGSVFGGSAFGRAFERAPSLSGFSFGQEDPEKFDNTFAQGGFNAFVQNHEMNGSLFMEDALFAGAGTAHHASTSEMTPRTEATSTTTPVAAAPIQAPPLLQQEASNMEQRVVQEAGNNQFQNYLKSTGHDEEIAAATAEAFQAFLKFQAAEKAGASAGNEGNKMIGREIESALEDDVSELGNSVLGNDWENGSFVSYGNMEQQRAHHERQLAKLAEIQRAKGGAPPPSSGASVATWGEIKQNESFVRRKTATSSSGFNSFTQQQQQQQQPPQATPPQTGPAEDVDDLPF